MKTEQKGQQTAENPSGQQKQGNQFKQDSPVKSDRPSSKPTTRIEDDEEKADATKREQGKGHPHDSETPVVEQKRPEQNQGRSLTESTTRDANQNQSNTQRAEQKN